MNRIYKTLWSRTKGCKVVVPEIAKNHGEVGIVNHRVGGGGNLLRITVLAALLVGSASFSDVLAAEVADTTVTAEETAEDNSNHKKNNEELSEEALRMARSAFARQAFSQNGGMLFSMARSASVADDFHYISINGSSQDNNSNYDNKGATAGGSIAIGEKAKATDTGAIAIGLEATVPIDNHGTTNDGSYNRYAQAIGYQATANQENAQAYGYQAKAYGQRSIAMGSEAKVYKVYPGESKPRYYYSRDSIAIGAKAEVTEEASIAIGKEAKVVVSEKNQRDEFSNSIAIGTNAEVTKEHSIAIGERANVKDFCSIAIGYEAKGENDNVVSIGASSVAKGQKSTVLGYSAKAEGQYGLALGGEAKAKGQYGLSIGHGAESEENSSQAMGDGAKALKYDAQAYGSGAVANGFESIAIGDHATTGVYDFSNNSPGETAYQAVAIGYFANAFKNLSLAIGKQAKAKETGSVALGTDTEVAAESGVALGHEAKVSEGILRGVAIGAKSVADRKALEDSEKRNVYFGKDPKVIATIKGYSGALSIGNKNSNITRQIIGVAAGQEDTDAVNVAQLRAVAEESIFHYMSFRGDSGDATKPDGTNYKNDGAKESQSIALGVKAIAKGTGALAIGYGANVPGTVRDMYSTSTKTNEHAIAIGYEAQANNQKAQAYGYQAESHGFNSIAIGTKAKIEKNNNHDNWDVQDSIAIGTETEVKRKYSIAIGYGAKVRDEKNPNSTWSYGIAIGSGAESGNDATVAIGQRAKATQTNSLALGYASEVSGSSSIAMGISANNEGSGSVAIGSGAKIEKEADCSVALGSSAKIVKGSDEAYALGSSAEASGSYSYAIGRQARALSSSAYAVGANAVANGSSSLAIGNGANTGTYTGGSKPVIGAPADDAIAMGTSSRATANYATAIGYTAKANKMNAIAIGSTSEVNAEGSVAIGQRARVAEDIVSGVALGTDSVADRKGYETDIARQKVFSGDDERVRNTLKSTKSAVSVGDRSSEMTRQIINVGAGEADSDAVNVAQLRSVAEKAILHYMSFKGDSSDAGTPTNTNYLNDGARGAQSIAIGASAISHGTGAMAIGYKANVPEASYNEGNYVYKNNEYAQAIGYETKADHKHALAYGYQANSSGEDAIAIGSHAKVLNKSSKNIPSKSVAIGADAEVTGSTSIALGYNAKVVAKEGSDGNWGSSIAIGASANVTDYNSIAIGHETKASESYSMAIGEQAKAKGTSAIAQGYTAEAKGPCSIAIGQGAQADADYSQAFGQASHAFKKSAVAIAEESNAMDEYSIAFGYQTRAHGVDSIAYGRNAIANGGASVAIGSSAQTGEYDWSKKVPGKDASYAVAIGNRAKALAGHSIAMGEDANAKKDSSMAIGRGSETNADYGVAMGYQARVAENIVSGIAIGHGSIADRKAVTEDTEKVKAFFGGDDTVKGTFKGDVGAVSVGSESNTRQIIHVAAGIADSDAVNVAQLRAVAEKAILHYMSFKGDSADANSPEDTNYKNDGAKAERTIAIGPKAKANRIGAMAIGYGAKVLDNTHGNRGSSSYSDYYYNDYAQAIGFEAEADQAAAQAYGYKAKAYGYNSIAIGREAKVYKKYNSGESYSYTDLQDSIAIGHAAEVTEPSAIAIGSGAKVTDTPESKGNWSNSIAIGSSALVTNYNTIAIGYEAKSNSYSSIALGFQAKADGGGYSIAQGYQAEAKGVYSVAFGCNAKSESNSYAIGNNVHSYAENSLALGYSSETKGRKSFAIGYQARTYSDDSQAYGTEAVANGNNSIAIGNTATTGIYNRGRDSVVGNAASGAIAIGYDASAKAEYTIAIGYNADAKKQHGVVMGYSSEVNADYGIAIGSGANVREKVDYGVALGYGSIADRKAVTDDTEKEKAYFGTNKYAEQQSKIKNTFKGDMGALSIGTESNTRQIINVAAGIADTDAVNVAQLRALEKTAVLHYMSFKGDDTDETTPDDTNYKNDGAKAEKTIAIGPKAKANRIGAMAIGYGAKVLDNVHGSSSSYYDYNYNDYAQAIGFEAEADQAAAQAYGYKAKAYGYNSIAIGREAKVYKKYNSGESYSYSHLQNSIAIGHEAEVTEENSIAIGVGAKVSKEKADSSNIHNSIAIGSTAIVNGYYSIAMGSTALAKGDYDLALGYEAKSTGGSGIALGPSAKSFGSATISMGSAAQADKTLGMAFGSNAHSYEEEAIAIGRLAEAKDTYSHAIGHEAKSYGSGSIAFGQNAISNGSSSVAIGGGAQTGEYDGSQKVPKKDASYAVAIGNGSKALAAESIAMGLYANAKKDSSIAIGYNSETNADFGVAMGYQSNVAENVKGGVALGWSSKATREAVTEEEEKKKALYGGLDLVKGTFKGEVGAVSVGNESATRQIINVAPGTADSDAVNVAQLRALKDAAVLHYMAFKGDSADANSPEDTNYNNDGAKGTQSVAIGPKAQAYQTGTMAIGYGAKVLSNTHNTSGVEGTNNFAQAIGYGAIANQSSAQAYGHDAKAYGWGSIAMGHDAKVYRSYVAGQSESYSHLVDSIAIGTRAEVSQRASIAIGLQAKVVNKENETSTWSNSIAIGTEAKVMNQESTAIGVSAEVKGSQSMAFGYQATADGDTSIAQGYQAKAMGGSSMAIGREAKAEKTSMAIGTGAYSHADYSMAIGNSSDAQGEYSQAIGDGAKALGSNSQAYGRGAIVNGTESIAIGMSATAGVYTRSQYGSGPVSTAGQAIAIGYGASAEQDRTIAIGYSSSVKKELSTAVGYGTSVQASYATAIGASAGVDENIYGGVALGSLSKANRPARFKDVEKEKAYRSDENSVKATITGNMGAVSVGNSSNTRQIINVAAGEADTDAVNVAQLKAVAKAADVHYMSFKGDSTDPTDTGHTNYTNNGAQGDRSIAIGPKAISYYKGTMAIGYDAKVTSNSHSTSGEENTNNYAQAIGYEALADNLGAMAYGKGAKAMERYGQAMGYGAEAKGQYSIAIGFEAKVEKPESASQSDYIAFGIAQGYKAKVTGDRSLAYGYQAQALKYDAIAIGSDAKAEGNVSIAFGKDAEATETYALALGYSAKAPKSYALAIGSQIEANGSAAQAIGYNSKSEGDYAQAIGYSVGVKGAYAVAVGGNSKAEGTNAAAFGSTAFAEGNAALALGDSSHAKGDKTIAVGDGDALENYAISIGYNAQAKKTYGVAVGYGAQVDINGGVAIGQQSVSNRAGLTTALDKGKALFGTDEKVVATFKGSFGAFAVGDENNYTRQIIGVAAGRDDTDAVNVAQLRAAVSGEVSDNNTTQAVTGQKIKNYIGTLIDSSLGANKANKNADNVDAGVWADRLGKGEVVSGDTKLVTGGKVATAVNGKANNNAEGIIVDAWKTKLGNGVVEENNAGFVTGGTVYDKLSQFVGKDGTGIDVEAWTKILSKKGDVNIANSYLVTGTMVQKALNGMVDIHGKGAIATDWAKAIGKGEVTPNGEQLVTGGTVYKALAKKADNSTMEENFSKLAAADESYLTNDNVKKWKQRLGVDGDFGASTIKNLTQDVEHIKAGYKVKVGASTFDVNLGETAPTIEFAGDEGNGLSVTSNLAKKQIIYKFDRDKLAKSITNEIINKINGNPPDTPVGSEIAVLTNVATGFEVIADNDKKAFNFGKGKESHNLSFTGTDKETMVKLTGTDDNPKVQVGIADEFKKKVENKLDTNASNLTDSHDILAWQKKLGLVGDSAEQPATGATSIHNVVTGLATSVKTFNENLAKKADVDASNIDPSVWGARLGTGLVADNDPNLVTGGKVRAALNDKAGNDASGIDTAAWATKLGTGTVVTGDNHLVTGGKVAAEVAKKADVSGANVDAEAWGTNLGTGRLTATEKKLVSGSTVFNALGDKADKTGANVDASAWGTHLGTGTISAGENKLVSGATVHAALADKANISGSNVNAKNWAGVLGKDGKVSENNPYLVTGGEVYQTVKDKADVSANNISVGLWASKLSQDAQVAVGNNKLVTGHMVSLALNDRVKTDDFNTALNKKANVNASNLAGNEANWVAALESKEIQKDANKFVTGDTVFKAISGLVTTETYESGIKGKVDLDAKNLTKATDILEWQKKLGIADSNSSTTTNIYTTVESLKSGYKVKAGDIKIDMKLGEDKTPTLEFAGDEENGLKVEADAAAKKITYSFDKKKIAKSITKDIMDQLSGGSTSGTGTPVLTNVSTGFTIKEGSSSKKFTFGKGKDDNNLTFAGVEEETSVILGGSEDNPKITVGLAEEFKAKVDSKVDLKTYNEAISKKANADASGLGDGDKDAWRNALGGGTNKARSKGFITGDTLHTALSAKADSDFVNEKLGKIAEADAEYLTSDNVEKWKARLGINGTMTGALPEQAKKDITNLKAGYQVKAGYTTFDMKLGSEVPPVVEFVGDTENGLKVAANGNDKKITYSIDKKKLAGALAADILTKLGGQNPADPIFTNVATGFDVKTATDSKSFTFGKGMTSHNLTFAGVAGDTTVRLEGTNDNPVVTVGIADEFKNKVDGKLDINAGNLTENADILAWQKKLGIVDDTAIVPRTGDTAISKTLTDLSGKVESVTNQLTGKANTNGNNISVKDWAGILGVGQVADNDGNLVTGNTVSTALKGKANNNAKGVDVKAWASTLGVGKVVSGDDNLVKGTTVAEALDKKVGTTEFNKAMADKADLDASNLKDYKKNWQNALGGGIVEDGNSDFVTGNTVAKALEKKAGMNGEGISVNNWIDKLGNGEININEKKLVSGAIVYKALQGKASNDAQGIDLNKWTQELGKGTIAGANDSGLVTGSIVKSELDKKADLSAKNIDAALWTSKLGEGAAVEDSNKKFVTGGMVKTALDAKVSTDTFTKGMDSKANIDASNLAENKVKWQDVLGGGIVKDGNLDFVTGGTVATALSQKLDTKTYDEGIKTKADLSAQNLTDANDILAWQKKMGILDEKAKQPLTSMNNISAAITKMNNSIKAVNESLDTKANTDAGNIVETKWLAKLGTNDISDGNTKLATSTGVSNALSDKADKAYVTGGFTDLASADAKYLTAENVNKWKARLGIDGTVTGKIPANVESDLTNLKKGYVVSAGGTKIEMKLGKATAPTLEFAGNDENGLMVKADSDANKVIYSIDKTKLANALAGDMLTKLGGENPTDPIFTNVATGFDVKAGSTTKSFSFGKGKTGHYLTFAGTADETMVTLGGSDDKPLVTIGLAEKFKQKVDGKVSKDASELKDTGDVLKWQKALGIAEDDAVTAKLGDNSVAKRLSGLSVSVENIKAIKADIDAKNVNAVEWRKALGQGQVVTGETKLVDGNAVAKALEGKANKDASSLDAEVWGKALGTGNIQAGDKKLVTAETVKSALSEKAGNKAEHILVDAWASTLGIGEVENGNKNLVTGGKVATALDLKANKDATDLDAKVWGKALGTGNIKAGGNELVTAETVKSALSEKANNDAQGIKLDKWTEELGKGTINGTNDGGLVTGNTVKNALVGKADQNANNINVGLWTDKLSKNSQIADNDTGLVTGGQVKTALDGKVSVADFNNGMLKKADLDAGNLNDDAKLNWRTALGGGVIQSGSKGFVTGETVHTALGKKLDATTYDDGMKTKVNLNADNLTTPADILAWQKKLGIIDQNSQLGSTTTNIYNTINQLKGGFTMKGDGTEQFDVELGENKKTVTFKGASLADDNATGILTAAANKADHSVTYTLHTNKLKEELGLIVPVQPGQTASTKTIGTMVGELNTAVEGKANKNASNITDPSDILAWQKALGIVDSSSSTPSVTNISKTVTNINTTVESLKSGYKVKVGDEKIEMKLGEGTTPVIEFAGDETNGLSVKADVTNKKVTYSFDKSKLVQNITGDVITHINSNNTTAITNVATGFTIKEGSTEKAFGFGKGKEDHKLIFAGTAGETTVTLTGTDSPTVTVGLDSAFKDKVNGKVDTVTFTNAIGTKANADASDLGATNIGKWRTALGSAQIAQDNPGFVTGGQVYSALDKKADTATVNQNLNKLAAADDSYLTADNIEKWKTALGVGDSAQPLSKSIEKLESGKANVKGDNIDVTNGQWASKLGIGKVAKDNGNLVTGRTVHEAMSKKADSTYVDEELGKVASANNKYLTQTNITNWRNALGGEIEENAVGFVTGDAVYKKLAGKLDTETFTTKVNELNTAIGTKADTANLNKLAAADGTYLTTANIKKWKNALGVGKVDLSEKANVTGDNIDVTNGKWASKLGIGKVAKDDGNLVTGNTVFAKLEEKLNVSTFNTKVGELTTTITQKADTTTVNQNLEKLAAADGTYLTTANIEKWKKALGVGKVDLSEKANIDGANITEDKWLAKLGSDVISGSNKKFVSGKAVFGELSKKASTDDLKKLAAADKTVLTDDNVNAWKARLGINGTIPGNVATEIHNIKQGMIFKDGQNGSVNVTLGNASAPEFTFVGKNGITTKVVDATKKEMTFSMNWEGQNVPKFHVYNKKEMRRRARSVDSTIGVEAGNGLSFNHLNMVFGEGLKATEETGPNNEKYIYVKSTVTPSESKPILDGLTLEKLKVSDVTTKSLTTGKVTADSVVTKEVKVGDKTYISDKGLDANGKKIANVLKGEADTDAVNVGQLKERDVKIDKLDKAVIGVGTAVGKLGQAVSKVQAESREGDAMSAAMAALKPLDFDPFKRSQIMAGVGSYRGKQAFAMGLAHYANEDTLLHAGLSYAGSSNLMANAGISLRFGNAADHRAKLLRDALMPQYAGGPISSVYMMQTEMTSLKKENSSLKNKVKKLEEENSDANSRIAELERQMKEVLANMKK